MQLNKALTDPWWMHSAIFCGFEGESDDGGGNSGGDDPKGDGGKPDSGSQGGQGNSGDDDGDDDEPDDLEGLKSALKKERGNARANSKTSKAEKQRADALQARIDELEAKDQSELEKATKAHTKSTERLTRLAAGYKKSTLDAAIEREARRLKFIDPDDAVSGVDRSTIDVTQNEDDPSEVAIDSKTLKQAVKALADRKKHLIGEPNDGEPSGSRFGGGGTKDKKAQTEEQLRTKYPSLG